MSTQATVYLALGSNLGDRAAHLHRALLELTAYATVEATSFLYETPPAYVTDQPKFLNAVCRVKTSLTPHALLAAIEETMKQMGRVRSLRYGPRIIDLDILFYDDVQIDTPDLILPHPRLFERDFVLDPLCDIAAEYLHPTLGQTMHQLYRALNVPPLPRVMPLGNRLWTWGEKTYIMGILNLTPDSFSGDGLANSDNMVASAVALAQRFVAEGVDCLDVGGISTRPGHALISVEEEIARVIPTIQALVAAVDVPISIDTFRAETARAALAAGAHWINDVWGLRYDPGLATLAAQMGVPLVVMHNRMQPEDADYWRRVQSLSFGPIYQYEDIAADVGEELQQSLNLAQELGAPRWLLVVDPGIGFGKTVAQQLELIDRLDEVRRLGYPLLFGASRKSFIGKVLGDLPPEERVEGTLATSILAVERGADIVRMHDVRAAVRALRMADAVVRRLSV